MTASALLPQVEAYLARRRGEGYAVEMYGSLLRSFVRFADEVHHRGPITVELALRWARSAPPGKSYLPKHRLCAVRGFARHLCAIDPATQVPPKGLLGGPMPLPHPRTSPAPTRLGAQVEEYLALRRRLGYRLAMHEWHLRSFARFAAQSGHRGPLTVDLATRWALATRSADPSRPTRRLDLLRPFARHLAAFEPRTEIPPTGLLGRRWRRKTPHVYSEAEVADLLRAAAALRPCGGLRAATYVTLFSLLASTGLRLGEALQLHSRDIDLRNGVLTVRHAKFGKTRLVPLHPSALAPLRLYTRRRDRCHCAPRSEFFFRAEHAPRLKPGAVQATFASLRRRLGWTGVAGARAPRIHDLRHSFAVRRLLRWYEQGVDVDRHMLHLMTYLGHVLVSSTYWYLTGVPELLAISARRFETFARRDQGRAP